jgi:citrate lyase subunit beta / citryl-CoA lyase
MTASYRSYLFVPATSGRKIDKAYGSAADAIILDLEDAVAVSEKPAARAALASIVPQQPARPTWVRINAVGTDFCFEDLQACCRVGVTGLILPKVESPEQLRMVDWILSNVEKARGLPQRGIAVAAIVETALGLQHVAASAAASPRLRRIMFGAVDLAADLAIDLGDDIGATSQARFAIACASRAAGLEAPVDTAYTDIANLDGLRATTQRAKALGFTGKACIHPAQIAVVNEVFTPTAAEVAWARKVVQAFDEAERQGLAAVALEGQMLDYPVVEKARRLLARLGPAT